MGRDVTEGKDERSLYGLRGEKCKYRRRVWLLVKLDYEECRGGG